MFGKALMEQQMIAATLSLPLRKQILSLPITFSDLEFVDPQLHRNLRWLDTCPDLSALCLDFTVTYPGIAGPETFELKPSGGDCAVSNANKEEYLLLRLRNRMLDSVKPQLEALLRGLYEVVPPDLLSVFDYQELELLMCGVPEISLEDWMRHTDYLADYSRQGARHRVIRWFWMAVEAMGREERVRLLQFTTGCSRLPAQGFKALQSNDGNFRRFNIQAISKKVSGSLLL
jgi:E3 ubiquitin ligase SMURF1/2/E3 ubiquitin-protein ligase HUWE1